MNATNENGTNGFERHVCKPKMLKVGRNELRPREDVAFAASADAHDVGAMSFGMQSFLCTGELRAETALPAEVLNDLRLAGMPPIASALKVGDPPHGEVFDLTFDGPPPAAKAVLHIVGPQLLGAPVFDPERPVTPSSLHAALALASTAGLSVPRVLGVGFVERRGGMRQLMYVVVERLEAPPSLADARAALITKGIINGAMDESGPLPRYDGPSQLLASLRKLAVRAGAAELEAPLARLEGALVSGKPGEWAVEPAPPSLLLPDPSWSPAPGSGSDAPAGLADLGVWLGAAVGDARLLGEAGAPWDLVSAFAAVVKARWLCNLLRRTPASAPRCSLADLLRAHDAGQALLVERGWLPAAMVAPGSSCAKLAETFPEELCPHYSHAEAQQHSAAP